MSASIYLERIGYIDSKIELKEDFKQFVNLYLEGNLEKSDTFVNTNSECILELQGKKICHQLQTYFCFFFSGFSWIEDVRLLNCDSVYLLKKEDLLDLLNWIVFILKVGNESINDEEQNNKTKKFLLKKTREIIDDTPNDFHWYLTENSLMLLVDKISASDNKYYIWCYSF